MVCFVSYPARSLASDAQLVWAFRSQERFSLSPTRSLPVGLAPASSTLASCLQQLPGALQLSPRAL